MHNFLNSVEVCQSHECVVTQLQVKTRKRLMLNISRMWKCGHDCICFNNIFYTFVEIVYYHTLWAVQQFYVVTTSCVCWVCWLRSWASIPDEMMLTWFYVINILFLEIEININAAQLLFKICHCKIVTWTFPESPVRDIRQFIDHNTL